MERLTRRINGVVVYVGAKNPYSTGQISCEVEPAGVREMMDRLAAYEDTRLTPEKINDLASMREISPEAEYAISKHAENIIERLDKLLHQTDDDARLRELAKADKDGRVVVLPCKVGDTVYRLFAGNPDNPVIATLKINTVPEAVKLIGKMGMHKYIGTFLTREAAEKALEAMEDD